MARTSESRRVVLHVGLPKTGTTFLQASLHDNKPALKESGFLYPHKDDRMFRAALDVRGTHKAWGLKRADVSGRWDELCRKARKHDGTTVISQELFASASVHQIIAATTMLKGLEVHVVVTARDLARQATAEWQEGIKHGRRLTFEEFRETVLALDSETDYARRFRAAQDLPGVLARWGSSLPPERVHVVCCPPPDEDPTRLWRLFGDAVGFDAAAFPPATDRANRSLGVNEVDLLRRVNLALDRRLVQPEYGDVVKRLYAQRLLAAHPSARPVVPVEMYDDLVVVGERWVKEVEQVGYRVHGDLAHLVPVHPRGGSSHPDLVDPAAQVETAATTTAELLVEVQRGRSEVARLEAQTKKLKKRRKALKRRVRQITGA